jgi:hypothetical protein
MSKPYAYTVARDGYHSYYPTLFPALDKAVAYLIKYECPAYRAADCQEYIQAYYEDGKTDHPSLVSFLEEIQVDLPAVVAYIEELWVQSEKEYAEFKAKGIRSNGFSGGPQWLCLLDKTDLIRREVDKRRWQWKVAT